MKDGLNDRFPESRHSECMRGGLARCPLMAGSSRRLTVNMHADA